MSPRKYTAPRKPLGLTRVEHAKAVEGLIKVIEYMRAMNIDGHLGPEYAQIIGDLCEARADQLAMGYGMTGAQWDKIWELMDDFNGEGGGSEGES